MPLYPSLSLTTALELANASKTAYEVPSSICEHYLGKAHFQKCDVFEQAGTQVFITSNESLALISFRGTEATIGQWLRNLEVLPRDAVLGAVHGGFNEALNEVWQNLRFAMSAHSVATKRVHLTGHSLGAALAALCGARMHAEGMSSCIECFYTFGQPMLATSEFLENFDAIFRDRYFRVINQADIVTRMPPGYSHVGVPKRITGEGTLEAFSEGAMSALIPPDEEPGQLLDNELEALNKEEFDLFRDYVNAVPEVAAMHVDDRSDPEAEGLFSWVTDHFIDNYILEIRNLLEVNSGS